MEFDGAAFDRWLTTEPEYPEEPSRQCKQCKGFLRLQPDLAVEGPEGFFCDGEEHESEWGTYFQCEDGCGHCDLIPHFVETFCWVTEYRQCRRCGTWNIDKEM